MVKNLPAMRETWVQSWVRKIPWRREWQPTPVSPWESDMPEASGLTVRKELSKVEPMTGVKS